MLSYVRVEDVPGLYTLSSIYYCKSISPVQYIFVSTKWQFMYLFKILFSYI